MKQHPRYQARHVWYQRFVVNITSIGLHNYHSTYSQFTIHHGLKTISFFTLMTSFLPCLFVMMNLAFLSLEFLLISLCRVCFFSQTSFVKEILARADMSSCNPCSTPMTLSPSFLDFRKAMANPKFYKSLVILPMRFNKFIFISMILADHISLHLSAFSDTFKVLYCMVSTYAHLMSIVWPPTLMLSRLVVLKHADSFLGFVSVTSQNNDKIFIFKFINPTHQMLQRHPRYKISKTSE
uniref:Uncharacterized protein n=1 Tax=Lactuca sativa TaxID=4236 RepID=A0A9R1V3N9_LACSA|nr:hypothetical protein LSAT_V11C600308300 [Lactuca sativa]